MTARTFLVANSHYTRNLIRNTATVMRRHSVAVWW